MYFEERAGKETTQRRLEVGRDKRGREIAERCVQRVLLGLNSLDPVLVRKEHSPLGKIPEAALITDSKPFPLGPYLFALEGSKFPATFPTQTISL